MTDNRQIEAERRMQIRSPDESMMSREDQQNAGGERRVDRDTGRVTYDQAPRTEYPRMMYRKTDKIERIQQTDKAAKCGETWLVVNDYGTADEPLYCDTRVAENADDAEAATAAGWEISPRAAYGLVEGLGTQVTAKDEEIARLKALLEESNKREDEKPRVGRPRKTEAAETDI